MGYCRPTPDGHTYVSIALSSIKDTGPKLTPTLTCLGVLQYKDEIPGKGHGQVAKGHYHLKSQLDRSAHVIIGVVLRVDYQ